MALTKDDLQAIANLFQPTKDDIQMIKNDVQELKDDVKVLKDDVQGLKDDVQVLKDDVQVLQKDTQELKKDTQELKKDTQELKKDTRELKNRTTTLELTLENETYPGIKIVAEGHLDLDRKLDKALKIENEKEILLLRLAHLESETRIIKAQLNQTA